MSFEKLYDAMLRDKKTRSGRLNFILPTKLGHVERVENVPSSAVEHVLEVMNNEASQEFISI